VFVYYPCEEIYHDIDDTGLSQQNQKFTGINITLTELFTPFGIIPFRLIDIIFIFDALIF